MSALTLSTRIRGSLFGLAICDALGAPVEFQPRGSFALITELEPNPNFSLPAGCFTDDTSMALCLAQSLIERRVFDAQDQARKYIAWFREGYMSSVPERGCFDIGNGTRAVLGTWETYLKEKENSHGAAGSEEVARAVTVEGEKMIHSRYAKEVFCGNGSLMRVTPIALAYHAAGVEKAAAFARESSKVTHPHPRCQEACSIYVQLVVKALHGSNKHALAEVVATCSIQDDSLRDRLGQYRSLASWMEQPEHNISSTGYVIDTLEAALWAFFATAAFEEGAIRVVNLGDDADTVGAVYGALAGAYYGFEAIPTRWMQAMRRSNLLHTVSDALEALHGNAEDLG